MDPTNESRFDKLLIAFSGTPVEAILLEMLEEFDGDKARAFSLVSLILARMEQIAEIWKMEREK